MEYSSSKKERLPGISFDTNFDNSSCSSSSATDDGSISQRGQISTPKHLKMLGPRANENINNQSTTPYNRKRRSLSQQPRRSSRNHHSLGDSSTKQRKRSKSSTPRLLSPTTLKLHETANSLVVNTPMNVLGTLSLL